MQQRSWEATLLSCRWAHKVVELLWSSVWRLLQSYKPRDGERAQRLGALAALVEGLGLAPNPYKVTFNCP